MLGLATHNAAAALGWTGRVGRLGGGSWADLVVLELAPGLDEVYERVVEHRGKVAALMIAGNWVSAPGTVEPASVAREAR